MAATIGFISEKGGVGKTTACYHIAVGLVRFHESRVLVVDTDYQRGGITGRFFPKMIEAFRSGKVQGTTLFHKFQQLYSANTPTKDIDIVSSTIGIDVIVADPRLSSISVNKLPSTNNIRSNNISLLKHLQTVSNVLIPFQNKYDYILIDSHPEISDVLRSVIYACDYCVSPVKLDLQSSIGVPTIISEIGSVNSDVRMIKRNLNRKFKYKATKFSGAIGMMAREWGGEPKESERNEIIRLRKSGFFNVYVTEGDGIRKAAQQRIPVFDVSGANAEKQSVQLIALTKEFVGKCK